MLDTVQVAVSGATFHFDKLYTYLLPPRLCGAVFLGSMVLVPFGRGNKPRMGVVLALFLLFYPVLTGVPMTELHASLLNWLPSWTLY